MTKVRGSILPTCLLLAIGAYVVCIIAQGFPLWSTGESFPWFPTEFWAIVELWAFVTGVVAVYLVVREHIWNWPIGIINVGLYAAFYFFEAEHYANAGLQVIWLFYLVEGWFRWARGGTDNTPLKISQITKNQTWIVLGSILVFTVALTPILVQLDGKVAFWDALTTGISLAAQFLLNRKVLQSWILWIIVDIIYVPLYFYRGYYATMVLYAIFLVLAISGYREWKMRYAVLGHPEPS